MTERKLNSSKKSQNDTKEPFKANYILIFSKNASKDLITWLIDRIERSQHDGGAGLLTRETKLDTEEILIEIGATYTRLLEAAESLEITKEDKCGNIREFVFSNYEEFLKPGMIINDILSSSDIQRIIFEEIMELKALEKKPLKGYPDIIIFPGQSVVQVCKMNGIIDSLFPLHEKAELRVLRKKWTFKCLPLGDVRNYFGEAIGFYFAFICFYTWALLPPAAIGTIQTIISFDISTSHVFFAIFKMIWLTLFLEFWKRKSNELAYSWGTLSLVNIPKLHPTFRGQRMDIDPVTKHHVPVYPAYKRHIKVYTSLLLVTLCLLFAFFVMIVYYEIEQLAMSFFDDNNLLGLIMVQLPGIIYTILVIFMNMIYFYVADVLTEWENHRTQESYDNHRIVKLLLFEFVNSFVAMGYIAFYQQDLKMLKWQICLMMTVNLLFNQFRLAVLPFLFKKGRRQWKNDSKEVSPRISTILEQREMWSYEGTYDDYLEVFIQFGNVFLFSSVFPLAAVLAILNNVLEMRMDGFKLCYSYQRPQARPIKGIGVWQVAFEVLSFFAVMSNCALISMSPVIQSYAPDMSAAEWLLVAVIVEHIVIAIKMTLSYVISDVPKWVKVAVQKTQYESYLALKLERRKKAHSTIESLNLANIEKVQ